MMMCTGLLKKKFFSSSEMKIIKMAEYFIYHHYSISSCPVV